MKYNSNTISSTASLLAIIISVIAVAYIMGNRSNVGHSAVAFIDFQAILQQSDAGRSINAQVEPRRANLQEAAEAKLKELKQEQDTLKQQGSDKSAAGAAALQKQIDDWNTEAQKRQAALNNAVNSAVQVLDKTLREQVEGIAEENKFTAVLPMQTAFYANKSQDVTSEAIRRLNKVLPKVDVKFDDVDKSNEAK